jgi:hypothetical protein
MKCSCNDPNCSGEVNFDSGSGFLIAEGKGHVIGLYLNIEGAVALAKQLKSFVIEQMEEPSSNYLVEMRDDVHD